MGFSVAGGMWTTTQQTSHRPADRSRQTASAGRAKRPTVPDHCRRLSELRYCSASPCKTYGWILQSNLEIYEHYFFIEVNMILLFVYEQISLEKRMINHVGWNSSKIISRPNSLRPALSLTPTWTIWCNENTPKIRVE